MKTSSPWSTEADLVGEFTAWAQHCGWVVYAEWAEWDLVLVRPEDGFQIGVEAKLSLNAKVLCQVLEHQRWYPAVGPDCHAVLVPAISSVNGLEAIAAQLGITVIQGSSRGRYSHTPGWTGHLFTPDLPGLSDGLREYREEWPQRCPDRRLSLPDYIPDVTGGHSAPIKLTPWKIGALKIAVIMETRGYVTCADFKALQISPSRWTQFWLTSNGDGGWVATKHCPDFKAQHPVNYEQIRADMPKWLTWPTPQARVVQPDLIAERSA